MIWGDGANDLHVLEAPNCPIKIVKDRSGSLRINELIGIKHTKCSLINKIFQPKLLLSVVSSVQSLSHVWLFVTPWTAALQASPSITNPQSLLKLMSIESVMPSIHLILSCPLLLLPSIPVNFLPVSNQRMTVLPSLKRNQG